MSSETEALTELARQVIETVQSVDLDHDLSASLDNLVVTCNGPGKFNIQIQTRDNAVDPRVLHNRVHAALAGEEDDD